MSAALRVLLADDHGLMRETLSAWLRTCPDIEVVATAADGDEALRLARKFMPDVVLMDIEMPGQQSFEAAQAIRSACAGTRIVFLSAFHGDRYIDLALQTRACGYIVKNESPSIVAEAIRIVGAGGTYFSQEIQRRIVIDASGPRLAYPMQSRASTLTRRELEILQYVAKGLSNKEIAQTAGISQRTVEQHISNMMQKLDIHNRVELARFAIQEGLASA